jgi:CDP-paratose 2-epimerase
MQSILITGGAGFVGSNLCLALRAAFPGASITALDNLYRNGSQFNLPRLAAAGVRFHRGDVRDPATFPGEPFDLMVECSAEPSVLAGRDGSPDYLFHTNLVGAYNCLEACRRHGAGMIFLSTSRIYPVARLEAHPWREEETRFTWQDTGTPGLSSRGVREDLPLDGARSLYGFTKLAAEQLIEEYRDAFGLKAVVNRCGVIAGPWQFGKVDQGVVALWVMAHHFKRKLTYIGYGGTGKQVRDLLHVHDLCDLIIHQVRHFDHWDGWLGNVAGGLPCSASLLELTGLCQEITGNTIDIASVPENRPSDLRLFLGDCAKLRAKLARPNNQQEPTNLKPSSFPNRTVTDIVAETHTWVRHHQDDLKNL